MLLYESSYTVVPDDIHSSATTSDVSRILVFRMVPYLFTMVCFTVSNISTMSQEILDAGSS